METNKKVEKEKLSLLNKMLNKVEVVGNKMPDPTSIFLILCILIFIISFILSKFGVSVEHPGTKEIIKAENLLSSDNLKAILVSTVKVFQTFPPLGAVLVTMIGIGLADKSGYLEVLLTLTIKKVPKKLIYFTVVFAGLVFTAIGDGGFIVLPPLAAIIFINIKKNPLIGIFLSFAGAAIGFCSGFFVGMNDILLSSFTNPAAQILEPTFQKSPTMTIYFNMANAILQIFIVTSVTIKFIEPRFPVNEEHFKDNASTEIGDLQKKGVKYASISFLLVIAFIVFLAIGPNAFLKDENGSLISVNSPLMGGLIFFMSVVFLIPGFVYGKVTKKIKTDKDAVKLISTSLSEMGGYILIVFVSAQFLNLFTKSNLGIIMAIKGANLIKAAGFKGLPLIITYVILVAFINLFIGSASAKWAILSPIFIPMFMLLGYDPALTQMAYRIGDSSTNMISPLFPYVPLLLAVANKYDKNFGLGTLMANMIPYSLITLAGSLLLFTVFFIFNIPFGI